MYSVYWFLLLWQQKLTNEMKKLSFEEIPQMACLLENNGIICYFHLDNIVFAFKKDQCDKVKKTVPPLSKALTIEKKRVLK